MMHATDDFNKPTDKREPHHLKVVQKSGHKAVSQPATRVDVGQSKSTQKRAALVVDDEPANQDFLVRLLTQANLHVEGASTGKQALEIVERLSDSLILVMLDRKLPDMTGIDVLSQMRAQIPDTKIMMATMFDEPSMINEAFDAGANAFLVKPHGFMDLYRLVNQCVQENTGLDCLDNQIFDQYGRRGWRRR